MGNTHTYRYIKVPAKPSLLYIFSYASGQNGAAATTYNGQTDETSHGEVIYCPSSADGKYPIYMGSDITFRCNKPFHGSAINTGRGSQMNKDFATGDALAYRSGAYGNYTSGFTIIVEKYI